MKRRIGLLGGIFFSLIVAEPKYLTSILVGGEYQAVAVEKNNVYLATRRGLEIASPLMAPVGAVGTPGDASDLVVRGKFVYIADGEQGVAVVDVGKPAAPVLVKSVLLAGPVRAVAAEGKYLFAGVSKPQCSILDLSNPRDPKEIATIPTENDIYGVTVSQGLLFLALESKLVIYDIKDIKNPKPVVAISCQAVGAAVAGTALYVVSGPVGLVIFDIKDPARPKKLSEFPTQGYSSDVKVKGGRAYLADEQGGLKILDVHDPAQPKLIGQYSAIPASVYKIALSGTNCFLALGIHTMRWIDVSNPQRPVMKGQFGRRSMVQDVDISGRYGVVTDSDAGLLFFDFEHPEKPVQYTTPVPDRDVRDVGLVGPSVYLAEGIGGVRILDAKIAPRLSIAKELAAIGATRKMVPYHSLFLVTSDEGILRVLEICSCGPLRTLSVIKTGGKITDVLGKGEQVFVADPDSGLFVYNLGQPTKPQLVKKIGNLNPVVLTGNDSLLVIGEAAVGDSAAQLVLVDPVKPESIFGTTVLPAVPLDLAYADGFVFCALGDFGFWVVDVKNPKQPTVVFRFQTPGKATRLATDGNLLLAADRYSVEVFSLHSKK